MQESGGATRDWHGEAKGIIRGELKRRGMTYKDLAVALGKIGITDTEANLRNKISRGNFTAVFMLQCIDAIGATMLITGKLQYMGEFRVPGKG